MRQEDDRMFWERLAEMPLEEHEQECVLRREHVALQKAVLQEARNSAIERGDKEEARRIGVAMYELMAQGTLLKERINYVRNILNKLQWKEAVRALYGQEAYEECCNWIASQEGREMPFPIPEAA